MLKFVSSTIQGRYQLVADVAVRSALKILMCMYALDLFSLFRLIN